MSCSEFTRPLVAAALAIAGVLALMIVASPPAQAAPPAGCRPAHVLVDVSRSAEERDPGALHRAAAVRAVAGASGVAGVWPFSLRLGDQLVPGARGELPDGALAPDDSGTDLTAVLAMAARAVPARAPIVVITDADHDAPPTLPDGWRPSLLLVVLGEGGRGDLRALVRQAGARGVVSIGGGVGGVAPAGPGGLAAVASARWCTIAQPAIDPVVLVSGLRSTSGEVRGATSAADCAPAGDLRHWCASLASGGREVWVAPASPRGGGDAIATTGRLDAGAARLASWTRRWLPGRRPILIGHSMGGLLGHAAITEHGVPAARLLTVGSPHAGSFGADAYLAARAAGVVCLPTVCPSSVALRGAVATVRARFGPALDDLTFQARVLSGPLPALPQAVPLAAYAAGPRTGPATLLESATRRSARLRRAGAAVVGYAYPNDGIVGVGSALGRGTRLRPSTVQAAGHAWHSASVAPQGGAVQLSDPAVAGWLLSAAGSGSATRQGPAVDFAGPPRAAPRREFPTGRSPRRRRPPRTGAELVVAVELAPTVVPPDGALVISAAPFGVRCGEEFLQAEPVLGDALGPGLFVVDLATVGCLAPQLLVGLGAPRPIATSEGVGEGHGRVSVLRQARGGWVVLVRSAGAPHATLGRRAITLRSSGPSGGSPGVDELLPRAGGRWRGVIAPRAARRGQELRVRVRLPSGQTAGASLLLP